MYMRIFNEIEKKTKFEIEQRYYFRRFVDAVNRTPNLGILSQRNKDKKTLNDAKKTKFGIVESSFVHQTQKRTCDEFFGVFAKRKLGFLLANTLKNS